jgi:hypothetical protein
LLDACEKYDLTGINTIRIPRVSALPPQIPWVGEGQPSPAVQFTSSSTTLGPARKLCVISAVTRELNEATPETAAAVIARVLADATTKSLDVTAFGTNPADTTRPAGLLYNVPPINNSAISGDDYMAMSDDLGNLAKAIGDAGIDPSSIIYVCGPREATIIKCRASELSANVLMTLGLPAKSVAAFAPAAVYSGYQDVPSIETSQDAHIHFEDTTPKEIVSTPGVVASPAKSMFQTETIAIKVRAWCSWAVAPGGVQVVENIGW